MSVRRYAKGCKYTRTIKTPSTLENYKSSSEKRISIEDYPFNTFANFSKKENFLGRGQLKTL